MADATELSGHTKKVYEVLQRLGATSEESARNADDLFRAAGLAKNVVSNSLVELVNKGIVKRKAEQKSARYYIK